MRVLANERLINNRSSWSSRLMLVGFGLIIASALLTWFSNTDPANPRIDYFLFAYGALFGGFIVFNIGAGMAAKWKREPRADQVVIDTLRTLDNRNRLYSYILPAEQVLLAPWGVLVFQVRRLAGQFTNSDGKWSHKRGLLQMLRFAAEEQVGNPTRDVQQDMAAIQSFISKNLPADHDEIPIDGLIIFSSPQAQLTLENPTVPVLDAKGAKNWVRQWTARGDRLSPETYNALADLFGRAEGEK